MRHDCHLIPRCQSRVCTHTARHCHCLVPWPPKARTRGVFDDVQAWGLVEPNVTREPGPKQLGARHAGLQTREAVHLPVGERTHPI